MIEQLLTHFRAITPEFMVETANYKLTLILHREMVEKLNVTPGYAAELVGSMTIEVDDDSYNAEPELFDAFAVELVRIMASILTIYTAQWGNAAAHTFLRAAAPRLSMKHS